MKRKVITLLTLIVFLLIISINFISIKGKEYTIIISNHDFSNTNINNIKTIQEGNSVSLIDKKIEGKSLLLKYRSINKGTSIIDISSDDYYDYEKLYVNHFGVITRNSYFGDASGDEVIPISLSIIIAVLIIMIFDSYRKSIKRNLYQYKNMYLLGLIIYLIFFLLNQINNIFNYSGLQDLINKYIGLYNMISFLLLPIGIITFLLVSISNIILIKKEGFSVKNMLGIILGIILCVLTIIPDYLYRFTYSDMLIDIHNEGSLLYYIYIFVETFLYSIVAYLECILIAVIILSIKAAKRIPALNKDYIIILGCMINKDGSLTNLLKSRVDRAIELYKMQTNENEKELTFVASGGKGNDEPISEGLAIKNYLIKQGISSKKIIVEDNSTNTYENFKYSLKKIKDNKRIAFSTTNYHVFRAGVEASNLNIKVEGIGSKTKRYFWINAFIREFVATLYYERKKHIIIFSLLLILNIVMIILLYLSI